tara:strand:- start:43184 stop:43774 length:591 start_codon:yes stop_codon:yes gene_type:complete
MKTLWDAVNELKGDLNNTWRFDGSEKYLHYLNVDNSWLCNDRQSITHYDTLGTTAEFNQLVKYMEYNFGKCSAVDIYNYSRAKKEPLKPIDKSLVYTQEMVDNGVMPSVGMEFIHKGEVAVTLSTSNEHEGVATFTADDGCTIECCWFNGALVKPIDTRTKKERAIDKAYKNLILASGQSDFKAELSNIYYEWVGE